MKSAAPNANLIELLKQRSQVNQEKVILVNEQDEAIGTENKMTAHTRGVLHRAFSVFVVNGASELLLQKRAHTKYHSRGLWSNTCCGHPRPGETIMNASRRRLREEMGFEADLTNVFDFIYRANLEDGFIENEYDHVLVGAFEGIPRPDPTEVDNFRWVELGTLSLDLKQHPDLYTYWLRIAFDRFVQAVSITS